MWQQKGRFYQRQGQMGAGTYGGEMTGWGQQATAYAMPLYSQGMYESRTRQKEAQRGLEASGFGPRRHGWPQYRSIKYGQSGYGQTQMGNLRQIETQEAQRGFRPPSYSTQHYGRSRYGQSLYRAPQYGPSQYGRSKYGSQAYGTAYGRSGYMSHRTASLPVTRPSIQPSMSTQSQAVSILPSSDFGTSGRSVTVWGREREQFSNQPQLRAYDRMYGPGRATSIDYPVTSYTDLDPAIDQYGRHPYGIPMGYGREVFDPQSGDYSVDRDTQDYFRDEQRLASARWPAVPLQRATGSTERKIWPNYPGQRRMLTLTKGVPEVLLGIAQRVAARSAELVRMPGGRDLSSRGQSTGAPQTCTCPSFGVESYARPGQAQAGRVQSGKPTGQFRLKPGE